MSDHFDRHGRDFGATTEADYEALAVAFLTAPLPGRGVRCGACPTCACFVYGRIHECAVAGDTIRFDPVTTELAILGANGFVRTYFKPTAALIGGRSLIRYFHDRCLP